MILQALNRYYDILASDPESGIAPFGYSVAGISYAVVISECGELVNILPLFEQVQRGKKTVDVPQRQIVPAQLKRTGTKPKSNFLCDTSAFVLGISNRDEYDSSYSMDRFHAFQTKNLEILSQVKNPAAQAVTTFLTRHDIEQARNHPIIQNSLEDLLKNGGYFVFKLDGHKGFVHEDSEIKQYWEAQLSQNGNSSMGQCLVTGNRAPIARLHSSLKGIKDANKAGATLVGFNARAYESHNKYEAQGLNAPVCEKAAFAYTTALNYLLSRDNPFRKIIIGDTTVVYWAESSEKTYAAVFANLFGQNEKDKTSQEVIRDKISEQLVHEIAEKIKCGKNIDAEQLHEHINPDTRFYVLGLAPNAARVSVRFFYTDPFYKMIEKISAHYRDMQIKKEFDAQPNAIPLWQIIEETVSKKSKEKKVSPLLGGALYRSILNNQPYPAALYNAIINRVRADIDDDEKKIKKINYTRAAIIKGYLIRKYRNRDSNPFSEVLSMSLNEQSTNPAYLLGRLFAVLEKAQQDAAQTKLNATIKDRYFTSACASPASVFPVLLRLSQHHISKAEFGFVNDRKIENIMQHLDIVNNPIPAHLNLDEQGVFILGYYHQRADFFKPNNETSVPPANKLDD
jgi:CRISPR-associated protein Csd1